MYDARHDEEGATATIVVFAILIFLLLVGMLAINIGSMWVSRRGQIADTDSAALAAAQRLTESACATDFETAALELVQDATIQTSVATPQYLNGVCDSGAGVVTVETRRPVTLPFFRSFFTEQTGIASAETSASASVAYGQVLAADKVRPIAVCLADLKAVDVSSEYPNAMYPVHRVYLTGTPDTSCVPPGTTFGDGNIGVVDFDNSTGASGVNIINDVWIPKGFPGEVDLGSGVHGDEDCNNEDQVSGDLEPCQGQPRKDLAGLKFEPLLCGADPITADCLKFYIVTYNQVIPAEKKTGSGPPDGKGPPPKEDASGPADGQNVRYEIASLARVALRGVKAKGSGDDYLDFEYVDELTEGSRVGAEDGFGTAPKSIIHCGVDGFDNCADVLSP